MTISQDRFSELISLYLDDEASVEELKLLSECVHSNPQMRAIFVRACRIHEATCRMYGKPVKLRNIYGLDFALKPAPKETISRDVWEWSGVAALAMLTITLSSIVLGNANRQKNELPQAYSENPKYSYMLVEFDANAKRQNNGKVFSVLKITSFDNPQNASDNGEL